MEIKDTDLWLKTSADMIVRDFLVPAGYDVVIPPIQMGIPFVDIDMNSAAATDYHPRTHKVHHIVIAAYHPFDMSRTLVSGETAAGLLAHELIHVAISPLFDDRDDHVTPEFRSLHDAMGLEGDYHASVVGPHFLKWVDDVVAPEYERRLKGGDVVTM